MKLGFVHIAKSGGNTIEKLIRSRYANFFLHPSFGHKQKNIDYPYSFAIVREPVDRFLSSYFYWKNGAINSEWSFKKQFVRKAKTIDEFMYYWDNNDSEFIRQLDTEITKPQWHFSPQKSWLIDSANNRTIILQYSNDIDVQFSKLLKLLGLPKLEVVKKINVTSNKNEDYDREAVSKWVERVFHEDVLLWNNIINDTNNFLKVIK